MKTIAMIGGGNMAAAIATRAIAAGNEVVLSNRRGPDSLAPLIAELGPLARAASVEEAGRAGDAVVLAIPFGSFDRVPAHVAPGKMLVDVTNYYPGLYAPRSLLDDGTLTSSELVQRHFAGARVVKAFNTIPAHHILNLARDAGTDDRTAIPVAADAGTTLDEASALLDTLGFDTLGVGTLAESWRFGPGTPSFVSVFQTDPSVSYLFDPGRPAPRAAIRVAIDAATR